MMSFTTLLLLPSISVKDKHDGIGNLDNSEDNDDIMANGKEYIVADDMEEDDLTNFSEEENVDLSISEPVIVLSGRLLQKFTRMPTCTTLAEHLRDLKAHIRSIYIGHGLSKVTHWHPI